VLAVYCLVICFNLRSAAVFLHCNDDKRERFETTKES